MKIFEITEAPSGIYTRDPAKSSPYGLEGKPDWYDRAVKLKTDNPKATFGDIAQALGKKKENHTALAYWLTGRAVRPMTLKNRAHIKDWPPFKPEDFPNIGNLKYTDGAKPEWYDQALQMAKAGETFTAIAKKFGIGSINSVSDWLVKGRKFASGRLINPDAELEPRKIRGKKLDVNLLNDLVADPDLNDTDILELIADEYGKTAAGTVKTMLPQLKQQQKASRTSAQVIDKTASGIDDPKISAAK
tara:strand:- start:615 stop:1352 length:738 start_codon:yes stop_codon:yes gene_type:complete